MLNLSESYASIRKWIHRRQLRSLHKETLAKYVEGEYDFAGATIGIGDALDEGILDPQYLQGYKLVRIAPDLDERVWKAWHDSSVSRLEAYKHVYGADVKTLEKNFDSAYKSLMPFEALIQFANTKGSLDLLKWLHALEKPWRPIDWRPAQLVGEHRHIGEWALDTFKKLHLSRGHAQSLARHLLWDEQRNPPQTQQPKWMRMLPKRTFTQVGWSNDRAEQIAHRAYMTRVLDVLLPPDVWDWRKRWESLGKEMSAAISMSSKKSEQTRLSASTGAMMAALLNEAPQDIQMVLCAFKRARHPDEPNRGNPDAQYIRSHFYAEKPPSEPISAIVSAAFLFIQGVDADVEVGFMLDHLTRDPNIAPESYSLDGLEL